MVKNEFCKGFEPQRHKGQRTIKKVITYKNGDVHFMRLFLRSGKKRVFIFYYFGDDVKSYLYLHIGKNFNRQYIKLDIYPIDPVKCCWCGCLTHLPEWKRQFFPLCPKCLKEHQSDWQTEIYFA